METRLMTKAQIGFLLAFALAGGCGSSAGVTVGERGDGGTADAAAEVAGSPPSAGRFEPGPCPFTVAAGAHVTCGFVGVPEDHAQPAGRRVRLSVAIVGDQTPADVPPLVYLAGGPGSG